MANLIFFLILPIILILAPISGYAYNGTNNLIWKYSSYGIKDSILLNVIVSPNNPDRAFANSNDTLYTTYDNGSTWRTVLSFKGTDNAIKSVTISPEYPETIYAGTVDGLYISNDEGERWEVLFKGVGTLDETVFSVAVDPYNNEVIFIGTNAGLLRTDNRGKDWIKVLSLSSKKDVSIISIDNSDPRIIYAASGEGLYRSTNRGTSWEQLYRAGFSENNSFDELSLSNNDYTPEINIHTSKYIKSVTLKHDDTDVIFIGTSKGLIKSNDKGETWKSVSSAGQLSNDIKHIVINPNDTEILYAATDRGVFEYSKASDKWEELYKGLKATGVNHLAITRSSNDNSVTLWAATDKGIYRTIHKAKLLPTDNANLSSEQYLSHFDYEPTIEEIQKATINYAEVHPDKIRRWRKAAAKKAWFPDLKIDYGKDRDWQSSTYFYSNSSEKYKDDDITKGKDHGWSISMTWELGDLIWNSDQTSIDTKSRLMVQLRDDVLNDVTRLYFERRRLQLEMLLFTPEPVWEKIEKDLRLQELTADIDAMTGQYFSRRIIEKKNSIKTGLLR